MSGYEEEIDDREPPQPTYEEQCALTGHAYYGDDHPDAPDALGGRCYCGFQRYPTGGPTEEPTEGNEG